VYADAEARWAEQRRPDRKEQLVDQPAFDAVDGYGEDGAPLSPASRRMLLVARR
jgi:hypothetical protein